MTGKAAWPKPWTLAVLVALGYAVLCLSIDVARGSPRWNASAYGAIAEIIVLASGALAFASTRSSRSVLLFWIASSLLLFLIGSTLFFLRVCVFVIFLVERPEGGLAGIQVWLLLAAVGCAAPILVVQWASYRFADRRYQDVKLAGGAA